MIFIFIYFLFTKVSFKNKYTIKEKLEKYCFCLTVFSPHGDVQEHLTCQQGARQGFHPNTGPVTRGGSAGILNKRPRARKARHNLSTSALTQADNTDRQREYVFLKSAEQHKRYISGKYKHLTTNCLVLDIQEAIF